LKIFGWRENSRLENVPDTVPKKTIDEPIYASKAAGLGNLRNLNLFIGADCVAVAKPRCSCRVEFIAFRR